MLAWAEAEPGRGLPGLSVDLTMGPADVYAPDRLEPYNEDPAEGLIRDALARTVEDRLQSNDNTSRLTAELRAGACR